MYKSPYEAYPFLSEKSDCNMCDFEIMTDEIVSKIGFLRAMTKENAERLELQKIGEIVYHLNPSLRTKVTVTKEELEYIISASLAKRKAVEGRNKMFVLPMGSQRAAYSHIIRNNFKAAARLLYREEQANGNVENFLFDLVGALSEYFFELALYFNLMDGETEIDFVSRNYKL